MNVLVLSNDWRPVHICSSRKALKLVWLGRAVRLDRNVVQWTEPIPFWEVRRPKYSRQAVVYRDEGRCRYCGERGQTIDHVTPRASGGETSLANCVLACKCCNNGKGDMPLVTSGLILRPIRRSVRHDLLCLASLASWKDLERWGAWLDSCTKPSHGFLD